MLRYRIAYIAACFLSLIAFLGTNQPAALGWLVLLLAMLVLCFLSSVALSRTLKIDYVLESTCIHDEELFLHIATRKPLLVPNGHVRMRLEVHSVAWDETRSYETTLTPGIAHTSEYSFSCPTQDCGKMDVRVVSTTCTGPLGLTSFPISKPFAGSYLVQPRLQEMAISLERAPHARFEGATYDHTRRGQDASETFDIREYEPGDSLRSIHWKLSSKMDNVLVREASQPSNYDTLVLFDVARADAAGEPLSRTATKAAYDLGASLSLALFRSGLAHDIAHLGKELLVDHEIDSTSSFSDGLEEILCTPMPASNALFADAVAHHGYRHNYTKIVLVTTELNTNLALTLGRTHDVSVVLVTKEGTQALEENDSYDVISVPADIVRSTRVLSI